MVTGFRVGRMAQEQGRQLVWVEMHTARGKTVAFVCSVVHALELAEASGRGSNTPNAARTRLDGVSGDLL
jgi:hypothetical protein